MEKAGKLPRQVGITGKANASKPLMKGSKTLDVIETELRCMVRDRVRWRACLLPGR
jgi:hypothetical protein